jgi:predicted DNA-binding protein
MADKKSTVAVTLEPELKAALEGLAKSCDRTIAAQVRALIRAAVTPQIAGVGGVA